MQAARWSVARREIMLVYGTQTILHDVKYECCEQIEGAFKGELRGCFGGPAPLCYNWVQPVSGKLVSCEELDPRESRYCGFGQGPSEVSDEAPDFSKVDVAMLMAVYAVGIGLSLSMRASAWLP